MAKAVKTSQLPKSSTNSIYWFRKCLRLHDNPALLHAIENSCKVYPVFILDPWFVQNAKVGPNRWRFLIDSLNDLNQSLMKLNSRLLLIKGPVNQTLTEKIKEWNINMLCFESDTEPYAKLRDAQVTQLADSLNVTVVTKCSHTLYDPSYLFKKNGDKIITNYQSFLALCQKIGEPMKPLPEPTEKFTDLNIEKNLFKIPDLASLNIDVAALGPHLFPGGETAGLKRFHEKFKEEAWICQFEKPKTSPNSLEPSTTVLSPYLKFGNLSIRLFYEKLKEIYRRRKNHAKPPESLEGQVMFREYFYFVGANSKNFDKIKDNPICRQIKWDEKEAYFKAWKEGRTGFPFIDAIMTQLRQGWIHHLARHAVACFLTRGDLYQSWERGQEVFEEYLLDADWSLNAANWQWLSASAFFHQYWKCYSPIEFGKKTDKDGLYIKKYLPVLKKFPTKYIYEPWTAPPSVQKIANCVIGVDYPKPIVDHKVDGKECMARMKQAFADIKSGKEEAVVKQEPKEVKPKPSTSKPKASQVKSEAKTPKISQFVSKRPPAVKTERNEGCSDEDQKQPTSKKAKIDQFFVKKTS